ncbi:MAG: hypothetical protein RLZZ400_739 [Actinomycetota bacterium]|jgi:cell division protein FtsB
MSTIRIVGNTVRSVSRPAVAPAPRVAAAPRKRLSTPVLALVGVVAVQIVGLVLSATISQGAYQLAALKQQNRDLNTQSEILAAEVDSLSSQQNLSDAAHALGMVSNTNPVFLRLQDQKVIGKPKAAFTGSDQISSNLVPNSTLIAKTDVAAILSTAKAEAAAAAASAKKPVSNGVVASPRMGNVATSVSGNAQISSLGSIQSSPTH